MPVPKPTKADYIAALAGLDLGTFDRENANKTDWVAEAKRQKIKVTLGDADRIAREKVIVKAAADILKSPREKRQMEQRYENREAWLHAAYGRLVEIFGWAFDAEEDFDGKAFEIQIATGFPRQDRNGKVVGQCWPGASGSGVRNIFVTPIEADPVEVLSTLLHETIHAHDDCKSSHKGAFRRVAKAVGFVGKPTQTPMGEELHDTLKTLSGELGHYPHTALSPAKKEKVQTTRMLKVECEECGCIARLTKKWLEQSGAPACGCGAGTMTEETK